VNSDPKAKKNFKDFGAYTMPYSNDGGKLAAMVAMAVGNQEAVSINGSGTQMIDLIKICTENGSTGTNVWMVICNV
jgi:hypothetical protein